MKQSLVIVMVIVDEYSINSVSVKSVVLDITFNKTKFYKKVKMISMGTNHF